MLPQTTIKQTHTGRGNPRKEKDPLGLAGGNSMTPVIDRDGPRQLSKASTELVLEQSTMNHGIKTCEKVAQCLFLSGKYV